MNFKKIMVVGCGRSGTLYITKVLEVLGFDIGHERLNKDGMASWFHSFGQRQKNVLRRELTDMYKEILFLHLVRNPIKVIESMSIVSKDKIRRALQYYKDLCPDLAGDYQGLDLATSYWVEWNRQTEKRGCRVDYRINVEKITDEFYFKFLCNILKVPYSDELLNQVRGIGNKVHAVCRGRKKNLIKDHPDLITNLTPQKLKDNINPNLFAELERLAAEYGYFFGEM